MNADIHLLNYEAVSSNLKRLRLFRQITGFAYLRFHLAIKNQIIYKWNPQYKIFTPTANEYLGILCDLWEL